MSCGEAKEVDWRVGGNDLGQFLADWAKRGYQPQPAEPTPTLVDGITYHRYRMIHIGD